MTDPTASMTDRLVKFSDGISSSPFHCRAFSCSMMSAISGSISARDLLHASGQDTPEARDLYESALDAACVCVDVRVGSGLGFTVGGFGCGFTCGEGEDGARASVEIGHALSFRRSSEEVLKWVTNRGGARGRGETHRHAADGAGASGIAEDAGATAYDGGEHRRRRPMR